MTAGGGGRGRGPNEEGWGARASSPFLWNKGKSVSEASVTPGRAKTVGRVGLATQRKFVRAGTPGPGEGQSSPLRGLCASPVQGGGQHGVWAQSWGGAARRLEPSPLSSPPPPGRVRSTKPSAHAPTAPRPKSQPARSTGVWEPNFFLPQNGHVSFFSCRVPPGQVAGLQRSCCMLRESGGGGEL